MKNINSAAKYLLWLVAIPVCVFIGICVFPASAHIWISLCVAIFACVPFFISFESRKTDNKMLVIISVMVALSIIGRYAFSFLPHFKPVTAIVIITGLYLGAEAGFLCGALSALISNFIFGQGPWTPFQMFAWGVIGLIAALISRYIKKSKPLLCLFGALAGTLYSALLDISATLWYDGAFNLSRYLGLLVTSLPVMAVYAVSNAIFLILLSSPIGMKLERIKTKYGL